MHDAFEGRGECRDALEVLTCEHLQLLTSVAREAEVNATVVDGVALAAQEPRGLRTLNQLDGAVVAYV